MKKIPYALGFAGVVIISIGIYYFIMYVPVTTDEQPEVIEPVVEETDEIATSTASSTDVSHDGEAQISENATGTETRKDTSATSVPVGQTISSDAPSHPTTTATTTLKPVAEAQTPTPKPTYKSVMTTVFWVGEDAGSENDYIANHASAWDDSWDKSFGGLDDPDDRCGYLPCAFTPKENAFYFALPYNEYNEDGEIKKTATQIPWAATTPKDQSLLKNHWIEVRLNGNVCYGQWEDVGPNYEDDFAYVFGKSTEPKNVFGERAGLDISPALRDCIKMEDNEITQWRFIDAKDVPTGPWKKTVTTSGINWK